MTGFPTSDQLMVKAALEDFLPDTCTVKRRNDTKTKGDYVKGTPATIATNVRCRVMPFAETTVERERLKDFPGVVVERADYMITLERGVTYKDGDTVTISALDYTLIAVRYDNGSWTPVVRALANRIE